MAESLKKFLKEGGKTMSSDAQVSKLNVDNANEASQFWYGDSSTSNRETFSETDSQADQTDTADEASGPPPLGIPWPDGTGTTIAILDSGINTTHMAFQGKISPDSKSFVGGGIEDVHGHGTQCAGLACGINDTVVFEGGTLEFRSIALGAQLMVCKVVPDGQSEANITAVCQALDYIINHNERNKDTQYNCVSVVSLSFGMSYFNLQLSKKIQEAIYHNIIIVCAASNEGRKCKQPITYPARLGNTLCIGSCNKDRKPSSFSPTGREMDFLAFGEDICAPTIAGPQAYICVRGTSFSTPQVAGLICQIVQDLRGLSERSGQPYIDHLHNVWGMREILRHMAVVQGKHDEELGYGSLNPDDYFMKTMHEKETILTKILCS